jgi:hypothetical protein
MENDEASGLAPAVVVDTSFLYAMGAPANEKYKKVSTYATTTNTTFYVPPRVYDECLVPRAEDYAVVPQVQRGLSDGWLQRCNDLNYQRRLHDGMRVATVMDRVRAKMAALRGGDEDRVEKADTALAGYAVQLLAEGHEQILIAMRDRTAEAAIMAVFADTLYNDRVRILTPREIFDAVTDEITSV